MSNPVNVAIVCVSKKALLRWLDFEGGIIHDIKQNPDRWNPDEIEMVLEHPDLDQVEDGFTLLRVKPVYHLVGTMNERICPPKKQIAEEVKK